MPRRKTDQEFKQEVKKLVGNEYTILETYQNNHNKLGVRHNKCKHTYLVAPHNFLSGRRCPYCYQKNLNNLFQLKINHKIGNDYTLISNYINNRTAVSIEHKCGYVWKVIPTSLLRSNKNNNIKCPQCHKKFLQHQKVIRFNNKVKQITNNEYTVIDSFTDNQHKVRIRHNKCGHIQNHMPHSFIIHPSCLYCECHHQIDSKKRHSQKYNTICFKNKIKTLANGQYRMISNYTNYKTPIKVKCLLHNTVTTMLPSSALHGVCCPVCAKNKNNKGKQLKLQNNIAKQWILLENYKGAYTHLKCQCTKCHQISYYPPAQLFKQQQVHACPYCVQKTKTQQKAIKIYRTIIQKSQYKREYSIIKPYINNYTSMKLRHNKCGYEFNIMPKSIINNKLSCGKCSHRIKLTTNDFKKRIQQVVGNEYTVLSEYQGANEKVRIKHNKCNYAYYTTPSKFLNCKRRCPKCAVQKKHDLFVKKDFVQKFYSLVGNEYTLLGTYVNTHTPIKMRHNKCGYIYKQRPSGFLRGNRCPYCAKHSKMSRGESLVKHVLKELGYQEKVHFYYGYTMRNKLHLDFYLPYKSIGIEYDGAQHFHIGHTFGQHVTLLHEQQKILQVQQERDQRKNKYCKEHHIKLIRIPYTVNTTQDIFNILKEQIGYNNNI